MKLANLHGDDTPRQALIDALNKVETMSSVAVVAVMQDGEMWCSLSAAGHIEALALGSLLDVIVKDRIR